MSARQGSVDTRYWAVTESAKGIVITCAGHDKEGTVDGAVRVFDRLARQKADHFTIVADLREMTGYESASRRAWQTVFREHRTKVRGLVLVGARSSLIRMGAAAVGAFAGIPVHFYDTMEELERPPSVPPR